VTEECRQDFLLDLAPRRREAAGDESHHGWVAVQLDKRVDVIVREASEDKPFRLQNARHALIVVGQPRERVCS
jgi:hypothetical protein